MKKSIILFFLLSSFWSFAQVSYTANDQVTPYTGLFRPGINYDYYPPYTGIELADISAGNPAVGQTGIGAKTYRPALYDKIAEIWGYDLLQADFQHSEALGMDDATMIIGFPAEWHRDHTVYCDDGTTQSQMFGNLYTPIWDGGANGTPYNDDNYLAAYLYKLVTLYKGHVKFWEIWNEPGFDHSFVQGWQPPGGPGNWWDNDPSPCVNHFKAPIQHFVRTLRISYDIIKTVDPDAYVTLAGVGFESFLDAVLRNTDNPNGGSVTGDYPFKGGAYFDVMGFHTYPDIDGSVREWDGNLGQWVYHRNSDAGAHGVPRRKNTYANRLAMYGYDGVTHPKKEWIITEINAPRVKFGAESMAGDEMQTNYIIKATVAAMKIDIRQMHPYQLADRKTVAEATGEFDLLGMYKNFNGTQPYDGIVKNNEGIAYKTTSDVLFGTSYDATKTAAMNLPSNLDGGAFYDAQNNRYKYVLWAKTTLDLSEAASGTYSFPSSFGLTTLNKRMWNHSETNNGADISVNNIALTGRPIFLVDGQDPSNGNLTLTCPANMDVNLPQGASTVQVTWSDATATTTCPNGGGAVTQTSGMTSGSDFWMGAHTVSYGSSDLCGNTANCTFTITVSGTDQGSLSISCPTDVNVTAPAGATSAMATWSTPTATTTCPTNTNVTISQTAGQAPGSMFTVGTHTIAYDISDACNNSRACTFSVIVDQDVVSDCPETIPSFTKLGEHNGHAYFISDNVLNWNAAHNLAQASGGYLASVNDAAENSFIQSVVSTSVFIGLQDAQSEGNFTWDSGEPVSYTNYSTTCSFCNENGPDFDYAIMLPWNGTWVFENQYVARKAILEVNCQGGGSGSLSLDCPSDINQMAALNTNQAMVSWSAAVATSTCSTNTQTTVTQVAGPTNGSMIAIGTQTVSYQATDNCNNTATCSFTVTVTENNGGGGSCDPIAGFTKLGEFGNHGYYVSDETMTWQQAQVMAANNNGHMATISSQEENDFIQSNMTQTAFFGLNDATTEGTVAWDNGDALSYTNYTTCSWCGDNTVENDFGIILPWDGTWAFNNQWVNRVFILETDCSGGGNGSDCPATIDGYSTLGEYGGHSYYLSDNVLAWPAAKAAAENMGGYLATMNDQAENDFVKSNLGNNMVFIGYNDIGTEGTGAWANGEPVTLDLSYSNTGDNDYAVMNFWAGTWQLEQAGPWRRFIVEMNCNGSTPAPSPSNSILGVGISMESVYPNPANDLITARVTSSLEQDIQFTIYNSQGIAISQSMSSMAKGPNEVSFDIRSLEAGMYFLKATGSRTDRVLRFVKMD